MTETRKINLIAWMPLFLFGAGIASYEILYAIDPLSVCYSVNPPDGKEMICGTDAGYAWAFQGLWKYTSFAFYILSIAHILKRETSIIAKIGTALSSILLVVILYSWFEFGNTDTP